MFFSLQPGGLGLFKFGNVGGHHFHVIEVGVDTAGEEELHGRAIAAEKTGLKVLELSIFHLIQQALVGIRLRGTNSWRKSSLPG